MHPLSRQILDGGGFPRRLRQAEPRVSVQRRALNPVCGEDSADSGNRHYVSPSAQGRGRLLRPVPPEAAPAALRAAFAPARFQLGHRPVMPDVEFRRGDLFEQPDMLPLPSGDFRLGKRSADARTGFQPAVPAFAGKNAPLSGYSSRQTTSKHSR